MIRTGYNHRSNFFRTLIKVKRFFQIKSFTEVGNQQIISSIVQFNFRLKKINANYFENK